MKVTIDRFEGPFAVCEVVGEKQMIHLDRSRIPVEAKEGDILVVGETGIQVDVVETEERTEEVRDLLDSLWE